MGSGEGLYQPVEAQIAVRTGSAGVLDPHRVILEDRKHSTDEQRYFCVGIVDGLVATVRYTMREDRIRIIGAGYWRTGKRLYYQEEL